jgi:hypothetical protein
LRASDGAILGTFPVGFFPGYAAFDGINIWVTNTGSESRQGHTVTELRPAMARSSALFQSERSQRTLP